MVKFYNTLFLLLICMFLPGKNIKQVGNTPAYDDIPDSLLTVGEIRKTVLSDPDKALYMLDVAEERKLLPTYQINWTRAQIYGSAKNMERVAVKWGKLVLEDDSVRNNTQYYFNMCKNLVESMIATGEYEEAIRYARSMIDVIDRAGKQKDNNHNSYWAIAVSIGLWEIRKRPIRLWRRRYSSVANRSKGNGEWGSLLCQTR